MKLKKEHYAQICEAIDNDVEELMPDYSAGHSYDYDIVEVSGVVTECEIGDIHVTCSTNVEFVKVFDEWRMKSTVSYITRCTVTDSDGVETDVDSDNKLNRVFGLIPEYENKRERWKNS